LNDASENSQTDMYRAALRKENLDSKSVLFSCLNQKFNRHGKVIKGSLSKFRMYLFIGNVKLVGE